MSFAFDGDSHTCSGNVIDDQLDFIFDFVLVGDVDWLVVQFHLGGNKKGWREHAGYGRRLLLRFERQDGPAV